MIFVHDVERGLEKLDDFEHKLIAKIVLQDYTHNETARLLGCWRRTVGRRFPEAIDQLTDIFLEAGLLIRLPATDVARARSCQEDKRENISVSDSVVLNENLDKCASYAAFWKATNSVLVAAKRCAFSSR